MPRLNIITIKPAIFLIVRLQISNISLQYIYFQELTSLIYVAIYSLARFGVGVNVTFQCYVSLVFVLLFSSFAFERSLKQIVVFVMVTVSGLVEVFLRHWGLFNKCGSLKQSKLLIPPFYVMATCGKHAKFLCDGIAFLYCARYEEHGPSYVQRKCPWNKSHFKTYRG